MTVKKTPVSKQQGGSTKPLKKDSSKADPAPVRVTTFSKALQQVRSGSSSGSASGAASTSSKPTTTPASAAPHASKKPSGKGPTNTVVGGTTYEVSEQGVLIGKGGPSEAGIHTVMDGIGCPKEYQFRHVRKVHKPQAQTPDHFAIGIFMHVGKARWFAKNFQRDSATWLSIQDAMNAAAFEQRLPVSLKARQFSEKLMREYMDHWSMRPKPKPIAAEYKLGPTPLEPGDPFGLWRTAVLDDVSHYPEVLNKLCLGETKTTSGSFNELIEQYTLHPQILLQMLLWQNDPNGAAKYGPIAGVMLDMIKKGYGEEKSGFGRHFIPVPAHALSWFARTLKAYLRALVQIDWDADAPRNPVRCTRMEGRARIACEYRELCLQGRSASLLYVMNEGASLLSWKPEPGKLVAPWT